MRQRPLRVAAAAYALALPALLSATDVDRTSFGIVPLENWAEGVP